MKRKFKHGNDIVTVTDLGNGMLQCETTNEEYNSLNEDGYWIAVEQDIEDEIKRGSYVEYEYKFVNLTLREGEREFDLRMSIQVEVGLSADEIFDKSIKSWFGEPFEINEKGEYEYDGGEYLIYGSSIKPMTKFEFDIVSKFT